MTVNRFSTRALRLLSWRRLRSIVTWYVVLASGGTLVACIVQGLLGLSAASSIGVAALTTTPAALAVLKPWRLLHEP